MIDQNDDDDHDGHPFITSEDIVKARWNALGVGFYWERNSRSQNIIDKTHSMCVHETWPRHEHCRSAILPPYFRTSLLLRKINVTSQALKAALT